MQCLIRVGISLLPALRPRCSRPGHAHSSFLKMLFVYFYFWLLWVFAAVRGLSLVVASGATLLLWCAGFSLQSTDSRVLGLKTVAHGLSCLWHVRSSQIRDQTHVSCLGWRILYTEPQGSSQTVYIFMQRYSFSLELRLIPLLSYSFPILKTP